jgi:hypothetical protein
MTANHAKSTQAQITTIPYHDCIYDWELRQNDTFSVSITDISPGYFCMVGLERVGTRLLYCAKISMLLAKLTIYKQIVGRSNGVTIRRIRKRMSLRGFALIIQESVDLLR